MKKKFTIEIAGLGFEYGVGKISKSQYKYWDEHSDELSLALNNNFDYEENKTPKSCQLKNWYNEYAEVGCYSGPLIEGAMIKILDDAGNLILNMDPYKIAEKFEDEEEFLDYGDEFQSNNSYDVSGYFIKWRLDGNGTYFRGVFEDKEFSIQKLKISIFDVDNDRIVDGVFYDNKSIADDGGNWSYDSSDYQVGFNAPVNK